MDLRVDARGIHGAAGSHVTLTQAFAEELKQWRAGLGYTQVKAADKLRVPVRTYEEWEQARRQPQQLGPIRKLMQQAKPSRRQT